jgi:hypothetical protein
VGRKLAWGKPAIYRIEFADAEVTSGPKFDGVGSGS